MVTHHFATPAQRQINRQNNRQKLNKLSEDILLKVPGFSLASDQNYREEDLAIDFCEDVAPLGESAVQTIV